MMRKFNNIFNRIKVPIPLADRILEIIALVMMVGLLAFTTILYVKAPAEFSSHLTLFDKHSATLTKNVYWFTAGFFILIMLITFTSAYNLKMINLPFKLKAPVIGYQKRILSRMSRLATICIGFLWLHNLLYMSASFLEISNNPHLIVRFLESALFIVLMIYTIKVWWIGRKF